MLCAGGVAVADAYIAVFRAASVSYVVCGNECSGHDGVGIEHVVGNVHCT